MDEIINNINRCKVLQNVDYLFKAICNVKKGEYELIKCIKEKCDQVDKDDTYKYSVLLLIYDYFYDGKCSRKEYIDFVNDYKKNSKFISDILLDLLK
jgi:hypothetical protein